MRYGVAMKKNYSHLSAEDRAVINVSVAFGYLAA